MRGSQSGPQVSELPEVVPESLEEENRLLQERLARLTEEVGRNDSLLRKTQERELELLRHAAHGSSVRELAERLCLSEGTVRNYLSRTMTKLGARNRIDAIRIARDAGWL